MSKVLLGTCQDNQVEVDGLEIPCDVLNFGKGSSSGLVVLTDGLRPKYLTSNHEDISELIDELKSVLNQVVTVLSGLDAVTTTPGSQAANITQINTLLMGLDDVKENLR